MSIPGLDTVLCCDDTLGRRSRLTFPLGREVAASPRPQLPPSRPRAPSPPLFDAPSPGPAAAAMARLPRGPLCYAAAGFFDFPAVQDPWALVCAVTEARGCLLGRHTRIPAPFRLEHAEASRAHAVLEHFPRSALPSLCDAAAALLRPVLEDHAPPRSASGKLLSGAAAAAVMRKRSRSRSMEGPSTPCRPTSSATPASSPGTPRLSFAPSPWAAAVPGPATRALARIEAVRAAARAEGGLPHGVVALTACAGAAATLWNGDALPLGTAVPLLPGDVVEFVEEGLAAQQVADETVAAPLAMRRTGAAKVRPPLPRLEVREPDG